MNGHADGAAGVAAGGGHPVHQFLTERPVLTNRLALLGLTVALYLALWLCVGEAFLPDGPAFATFIIWLCAHIGGGAVAQIGLPPLLGMLLSGLILRNLPGGLVDGLPDSWSSAIRASGLSIILTRSGLELDLGAFRRIGLMAVRLTAMPGVSEAIVVGGVATALFGMPMSLGVSLGFILGAVSPAVVVLGMFELQREGYGVDKGIPSLVVAAASFDDVLAISGFSICSGLALSHGGSLAWEVLHGPLNLFAGVFGGALFGLICCCTVLWDTRFKRSAAVFLLAQAGMFLGAKYHFTGAGAMGGLVLAIVASKGWAAGTPKMLSKGPNEHYAHVTEADLAVVWQVLGQPLLFGVIGSAVDFETMDTGTIPTALLCIFIGLCVRLPMAYAACSGGNLTPREKLFIGLAWIPKATVQAALASVPLDLIKENMHNEDDYDKWLDWGTDILTTAVFSIICTAPVGMIFINVLGPRWLNWTDPRSPEDGVELAADGGGGGSNVKAGELTRSNSSRGRRNSLTPRMSWPLAPEIGATAVDQLQAELRATLGGLSRIVDNIDGDKGVDAFASGVLKEGLKRSVGEAAEIVAKIPSVFESTPGLGATSMDTVSQFNAHRKRNSIGGRRSLLGTEQNTGTRERAQSTPGLPTAS